MKKTIFEIRKNDEGTGLEVSVWTENDGLIDTQDVVEFEDGGMYEIENYIEDYMLEFNLEDDEIEIRKDIEIDTKLIEILEKEILTVKELEFVEEHEDVENIENCGNSGRHVGKKFYNVILIDGREFEIYL